MGFGKILENYVRVRCVCKESVKNQCFSYCLYQVWQRYDWHFERVSGNLELTFPLIFLILMFWNI